jgi:hypothetical protein
VTTVRFDIQRPASELANRLDRAAESARIRLAMVDAVNDVTQRFELTAARAMNAGLMLEDSYVRSKMTRKPAFAAGRGAIRSEIETRGDLTIIGHYPHQQLRQAGTAVRSGTSRGRRPSGARVEIKRGAAVTEPQWFVMKLRGSGKDGLFVRTSEGRTKHLYGPSPYSLFRFQIGRLQDDLQDDLQATAGAGVAGVIERSLIT